MNGALSISCRRWKLSELQEKCHEIIDRPLIGELAGLRIKADSHQSLGLEPSRDSRSWISGTYRYLRLRLRCGAICLIAMFAALSDQEPDQEKGASRDTKSYASTRAIEVPLRAVDPLYGSRAAVKINARSAFAYRLYRKKETRMKKGSGVEPDRFDHRQSGRDFEEFSFFMFRLRLTLQTPSTILTFVE